MKTKTLLTLTALTSVLMAGCTNDEPLVTLQKDNHGPIGSSVAKSRTVEDVLDIANNLAAIGGQPTSRGNRRVSYGRDAVCAIGTPSSRGGGRLADTLLYAVNYDNGQGYALIAAPENVDPIIGIVESGEFATFETVSNGGFQFYLDAAKNYIRTMSVTRATDPPIIIKPMFHDVTHIYNDTIAPRIKVKWRQHYPEGYLCPNKVAGCVMTAMVQMLSYIEAPSKITLTYPERDRSEQVLNWAEIKKHRESIDRNDGVSVNQHLARCGASQESQMALARVVRELGHRNNARYSNSPLETGSDISVARRTLISLLPNHQISDVMNYGQNYSDLSLFGNLTSEDRVIFMQGRQVGESSGHAWILDGGLQVGNVTYRTYSVSPVIGSDQKTFVTERNLLLLFHFNWGWNGFCDGYFLPDVFEPGDSVKYDKYGGGSMSNYSENVRYFMLH